MKKFLILLAISLIAVLSAIGLTACGTAIEFRINFISEGEIYAVVSTGGNETIKLPDNPQKEEYTFEGWFWDKDVWEKPFTANSLLNAPLSSDMSVYAKFKSNHTHEYTETITKQPTCTEKGEKTFTCVDGDDSYTEELAALGHTSLEPIEETRTEPTCTKKGSYDLVTYCAVCGEEISRETVELATLSHFPAEAVQENRTEPTCTEKGSYDRVVYCTVCEEEISRETVEIAALEHSYTKTITQPTCTEQGFTTYTCNRCGDSYTGDYITALGHIFTNYVSDNNATYEQDGTKTAYCNRGCGATDTVPDIGSMLIENGISFSTLSVNDSNVYGKVSNDTATFSFLSEIKVSGKAKYTVSFDRNGNNVIASKNVDLKIGDNIFYITVTVDGDIQNFYEITLRRRPVYTVTFNVNGGSSVSSQQIEEDRFATVPITTRAGYTFTGWNYDFTAPIIKNTTVSAGWKANTDTKYKVEYYLQNLEDDDYSLQETENLTGTTDTIATAEIKTYEHFTPINNSVTGNINGNESTVLKVYYTRNKYYIKLVAGDNVTLDKSYNGYYKYGYQIEVTATYNEGYLGYEWKGWHNGDNVLTYDKTISAFIADKDIDYTADFAVKKEMSDFYFTSTKTTCEITGVKNKKATQVIIPDYITSIGEKAFYNCSCLTEITIPEAVTSIGSYAFYGCTGLTIIIIPDSVTSIGDSAFSVCSSLESITIPFVGGNKEVTEATISTLFGYIFGTSNYTGGTKTTQYYTSGNYTTYYIPSSLKTITVTGGNILYGAFSHCSSLTEITIPDSVTSIGERAFAFCSSLTEITIPDSVTSIGGAAFSYCSSLTSVTIGNSVTSIGSYAFGYCSGLTEITIPEAVTYIGENAFRNCNSLSYVYYNGDIASWCNIDFGSYSNPTYIAHNLYINNELLKDLIIPSTVTKIKNNVFDRVTCLTSVIIPDSVTSIGDMAFFNCSSLTGITIGNSVTSIGKNSFYGCTGLTSVTIGNSVTSIGSYAFYGCTGLTIIIIPDSVTSIGDSAFSVCSSLESITIPFVGGNKEVTEATISTLFGYIFGTSNYTGGTKTTQYYTSGNYTTYYIPSSLKTITVTGGNILYGAFYNCSGLTSVTIGNSVTSIGDYAFYNCSSLKEITIPDSVTSIGKGAFAGCRSLTEITIPDSVTSIGNYAFRDCSSLKEITIPDSVTSIGYDAFYNCSRLTSITIPDSVTSIGNYAFYNCSSLTEITIPDSVTSIGYEAFRGCSSLTAVTIGNSVTSIGSSAFYNCSSLTSVNYAGTTEEWKAISKGSSWKYNVPSSCKVICTNGTINI